MTVQKKKWTLKVTPTLSEVLKRDELSCQKRDVGEHDATRDTCLFTVRESEGRKEGKRRLQNLMFNS